MSAEKYAKSALRTVMVSRVCGEILAGVGAVLHSTGRTLEGLAQSTFIAECDAARRYNAATGYDLGAAQGYPTRYSDDVEMFSTEGPGEDEE